MSKNIFFLTFLLSLNFAFAQMVNGIAAVVENEPITLHELYKTSQILKTDERNALNFLIKDRLEKAQIKALKIEANDFEISEKIKKIAQESGLNVLQLRNTIISQGVDYAKFKEDVAKGIKQEKLYQNIFKDARINVTPEAAKAYFEQNPQMFLQFNQIKMTRYVAQSRDSLEMIQASPMSMRQEVSTENLELKSEQLPPQLRAVLNRTPNGSFTQIFQTPSGFEMFLVNLKSGEVLPNFQDIQNEVMSTIYNFEQDRVVTEYFNKLRAKADIKYLR